MKNQLAAEYANLVYNGLWFTPLRQALDAFVNETQRNVTGLVRLKLYKGNVIIAGRKSVHSLYNAKLATYTEEDTFDHKASEGFIAIYGLPVKTYHQVEQRRRDGDAVRVDGHNGPAFVKKMPRALPGSSGPGSAHIFIIAPR